MSWQATAYVAELTEGLTRSEKLLLMCLSNRHNVDQDKAWPSVGRLAREALMSERTVFRTLERLEIKGLITVDRRPGHTSGYAFVGFGTPDKLAGVAQPSEREMSPPPLTNGARNVTPPLTKRLLTPDIALSPKQRTVREKTEPKEEPADPALLLAQTNIFREAEKAFGRMFSAYEVQDLKDLEDEYPRETWLYALREAADLNKKAVRYVQSVCKRHASGEAAAAGAGRPKLKGRYD